MYVYTEDKSRTGEMAWLVKCLLVKFGKHEDLNSMPRACKKVAHSSMHLYLNAQAAETIGYPGLAGQPA